MSNLACGVFDRTIVDIEFERCAEEISVNKNDDFFVDAKRSAVLTFRHRQEIMPSTVSGAVHATSVFVLASSILNFTSRVLGKREGIAEVVAQFLWGSSQVWSIDQRWCQDPRNKQRGVKS